MGLFALLFIPVFWKKGKPKKNSFEHTLARMGITTFGITGGLTVVSVFIFSVIRDEFRHYVSSFYWAFFVIVYHVPSLVYCKNRLCQKRPAVNGLPGLTKRENEVVMKMCQGHCQRTICLPFDRQKIFIQYLPEVRYPQ
jgi:hypothetical protein